MMHSARIRSRVWAGAALTALCVAAAGCNGQNDSGAEPRTRGQAEPTGRAGEETAPREEGAEPAMPARAPRGTFSPQAQEEAAADEQGRLPAAGDMTVYIPSTDLFPGAARIDPGVTNPYSGDPDAIAAGERHFAAFNCGGCHAPLGGGGMGPPLSDDDWIYGEAPGQIYLSIMHGRPEGMPAWSSMLPRRAVWELVAYIETLAEIEDYAAEKGFDSTRAGTAPGNGTTAEADADESSTGQ